MDIDLTLLVQMALLTLLMGLMRPWVYAPLLQVIDRRAEAIQGTRAEAQRLERMAAADQQAYQERMLQARREALALREQLRHAGRAEAAELMAQARAQAQQHWLTARARIDAAAQQVGQQLSGEVEALSVEVSHRLLETGR